MSSLQLKPALSELATLVAYIEEEGERGNLSAADIQAFTLASEELFANTVTHSYPPATLIEFSLTVTPSEILAIYSDDSAPFDPTAYPEVDTTLPVDQRPIGGLGIHFIRRTMQSFRYERFGGRNTVLFGRARRT